MVLAADGVDACAVERHPEQPIVTMAWPHGDGCGHEAQREL